VRFLPRTFVLFFILMLCAWRGESSQAQMALATLAEISQQQAEKIRSARGDRKAGYEDVGVK
jgi:hypothetical protein